MDVVVPCTQEELFLKIAVPKWNTKSLKSTCEVLSFSFISKLKFIKEKIFLQVFLKDFARITRDLSLYGIVNNLIIYFAKAFRYFSHYKFTTLLLFSYHVFRAAFL